MLDRVGFVKRFGARTSEQSARNGCLNSLPRLPEYRDCLPVRSLLKFMQQPSHPHTTLRTLRRLLRDISRKVRHMDEVQPSSTQSALLVSLHHFIRRAVELRESLAVFDPFV